MPRDPPLLPIGTGLVSGWVDTSAHDSDTVASRWEAKKRGPLSGRPDRAEPVASPTPCCAEGFVLPVLGLALVALAGAHAFDYVTFLVMVGHHGLAAELNPIVQRLAEEYGLPGLTIAKSGAVIFLGASAVLLAPRRRRFAMFLVLIGVTLGLVGGISNVISI
jgi:hypothetical protein